MSRKRENQLNQRQRFGTSSGQTSREYSHNIPQIKWACPPQFTVNPNWKMETGSDSEETRVQLQRELTTHEKIYLHNIPSNPSVESDALDFNCDDISVPVIPLDVIDETTPNDTTSSTITQPLLQRDDVIGTAVALIALIKSKDSRNEIDLELLIQLLQNPGMLEKLTKEHGLSANQNSVITCARPHESLHVPSDLGRNMMDRIYRKPESQSDGSMEVSKFDVGRVRKLINEYGECLGTDCVKTGKIKDLDYYRRLVSQHGMVERRPQGVQVQVQPCVYFNSPKGCRRGSNCRFQHVRVHVMPVEEHVAKRMKPSCGNFARQR